MKLFQCLVAMCVALLAVPVFAGTVEKREDNPCSGVKWAHVAFLWGKTALQEMQWADFEGAISVLTARANTDEGNAQWLVTKIQRLTPQERHCATDMTLRQRVLSNEHPEALQALKERFVTYYATPEDGQAALRQAPIWALKGKVVQAERFADFNTQEQYLSQLAQLGDDEGIKALAQLRSHDTTWRRQRTETALTVFRAGRWSDDRTYQRLKRQLHDLYSDDPAHAQQFLAELEAADPSKLARQLAEKKKSKVAVVSTQDAATPPATRDQQTGAKKSKRSQFVGNITGLITGKPVSVAQIFTGRFTGIDKGLVTVSGQFIESSSKPQTIRCQLDNRTKGIEYVGTAEAVSQQFDKLLLGSGKFDPSKDVSDSDLHKRLNERVEIGVNGRRCLVFRFSGK